MSNLQLNVAIGDTFLKALMALPEKAMKRSREAITKFQTNPTSKGLYFKKLSHAKDARLHSFRVDDDYRCIVLKPEKGDTYLLLWVDKHDAAYAWAENRSCGVNPHSGAIQVVEVEEQQAAIKEVKAAEPVAPANVPGIFDKFSDADLQQLGSSEESIILIRSIQDESALEDMQRRFPAALYDGLFMLACGENFDEVLDELGITKGESYDPDDFESALELPANQHHFAAVSDDAELEAILNEPLAFWRVFLHPSQRRLVRANFNGPARVLGGAGTGKTVVAMHRAKYLASQCSPGERILFTTFTKSLVNDIKQNLQKICSYDEIKRIEVVHLDSWCRQFLLARKFKHDVAYQKHPKKRELWEKAVREVETGGVTEHFLREEWDRVIQYHDIETFADYARIPRVGRRTRLGRAERKAIWPVFEEYRTLLNEHQLWEPPDMMRAARSLLETGKERAGFKHIIVDEIQDFHPQAFRLLRAMVPPEEFTKNDLFLVGDGHQNVYGHNIILSRLGIDIVGRGRRLRLNYRTPEETRQWATAMLEGVEVSDLDGGTDQTTGYRSVLSGPLPQIAPCRTSKEELSKISSWIHEIKEGNPDHIICVTLRTNDACKDMCKALRKAGHDVHELTSNQHDIPDTTPIRVANMHRIKGLEFDHVCLAGRPPDFSNFNEQARAAQERCLLHVAATRTKNSLLVTSNFSLHNNSDKSANIQSG